MKIEILPHRKITMYANKGAKKIVVKKKKAKKDVQNSEEPPQENDLLTPELVTTKNVENFLKIPHLIPDLLDASEYLGSEKLSQVLFDVLESGEPLDTFVFHPALNEKNLLLFEAEKDIIVGKQNDTFLDGIKCKNCGKMEMQTFQAVQKARGDEGMSIVIKCANCQATQTI